MDFQLLAGPTYVRVDLKYDVECLCTVCLFELGELMA